MGATLSAQARNQQGTGRRPAPYTRDTSPSRRRGLPLSAAAKVWLGLAGVASLIVVMEAVPRVGIVDPRHFPPFSEMAAGLVEHVQSTSFWIALGQTLRTWATALVIAVVSGTVLGMIIGSVGFLRKATASTIEFMRPIPSVALIPLAVLMFGTDMESTLLLAVYASFWPVLIQVLAGTQDIDPVTRDTARSYRFRFLTQGYRLVWPTTLPYAVTGLRLAATVALILTITGELIIGTPGLGHLTAVAQNSGAVASMYALVIVTGLLGVGVNLLARYLERRLLHWHPSVRLESKA